MYADGSIFWVSLSQIAILRKTGVLFIVLTTERGNRKALVARFWSRLNRQELGKWHGEDIYYIGVNSETGEYFPHALDDKTFTYHIRKLANPTTDSERIVIMPPNFPPGFKVHEFKGAWIDSPEWEAQLKIFDSEMF